MSEIKILNNLMSHIEKHYPPEECENCEIKTVVVEIEIDPRLVRSGDQVVGGVWYECPECGNMESSDLRFR
ncbi:MAG: hypothetical protein ACYSYL_21590 [Planctomycetota bacterium]|jgi:hypothetical protein